jgi:hypothetical protein
LLAVVKSRGYRKMGSCDFALLCGKAFLNELSEGRIDSAIAFGRAFLIALGEKDLSGTDDSTLANGRNHQGEWAHA